MEPVENCHECACTAITSCLQGRWRSPKFAAAIAVNVHALQLIHFATPLPSLAPGGGGAPLLAMPLSSTLNWIRKYMTLVTLNLQIFYHRHN